MLLINVLQKCISKNTQEVNVSNLHKNGLFKQYRKHLTDTELLNRFIGYRKYKNKLIKIAINNFYEKQMNTNKNSSKHLWRIINNVTMDKNLNKIEFIINENNNVLKNYLN